MSSGGGVWSTKSAVARHRGTEKCADHVAARAADPIDQADEGHTTLGPSRSSTTTLRRLITGFERPDEGSLSRGGVDATSRPTRRRDVDTIVHDRSLLPYCRVAPIVNHGLHVREVPRVHAHRCAASSADVAPGDLPDVAHRRRGPRGARPLRLMAHATKISSSDQTGAARD